VCELVVAAVNMHNLQHSFDTSSQPVDMRPLVLLRIESTSSLSFVIDALHCCIQGPIGHITLDDISTLMPQPAQDNLILVCGPPGD
jgi:hypothetical protein